MTPNEITTLIATNLDKELDLPFKLQLMERVKYWRSRLIANSVGKEPAQRKFFRQSLYLQMSTQFANDAVAGVGKPQSISTKIPLVVRINTTIFDYVGGIDGQSPFREIQPGTGNYLTTGKFAGQFIAYEYANQRIYTDKTNVPMIRVDAIFDDPMAVQELSCSCQNIECDTWDSEFPCSGDIMQLIVQSILTIDYNRPDTKPTSEIQVDTK